ncbi:MAG TPA: DUF72 domain-containing protein [Xanthobacteraceae bacterium]|jgi:uncharacterized protein YecE (DUF72 family)|nr:DUF72 domain-containing protein [Xanthobacteraceae bacterium]
MINEIRIGTSGWHYASWRGPFYAADERAQALLAAYARYFRTTEINASFYRLPAADTVRAWRDQTPGDFLFAWKASRYITHFRRIKDVDDSIKLVFGRMKFLGKKFGPGLFQLPPQMHADRDRLARFFKKLPARHQYTIEFRHSSWYAPKIFDVLRDFNVSLCLSDHRAAPAPWEVTAQHVYVRGHGPQGDYSGRYTPSTLRSWARQMSRWKAEGRSVYCYFDNDQKSAAPFDALKLMELVGTMKESAPPFIRTERRGRSGERRATPQQ